MTAPAIHALLDELESPELLELSNTANQQNVSILGYSHGVSEGKYVRWEAERYIPAAPVGVGTVAVPLVWGTGSTRYKVEYFHSVEVGSHAKSSVMSLMSKLDAELGKIVMVAQELSLALYRIHKSGTAITLYVERESNYQVLLLLPENMVAARHVVGIQHPPSRGQHVPWPFDTVRRLSASHLRSVSNK
jgi:hypothetical protein